MNASDYRPPLIASGSSEPGFSRAFDATHAATAAQVVGNGAVLYGHDKPLLAAAVGLRMVEP